MANQDIPCTAATSAVAATVTVNGGFSSLRVMSLTAAQPIYIRTDGTAAVVEADANYVAVPFYWTTIPTTNGGATTNISAISSAAAKLYVTSPDTCDFDD